jgi:hypothetical protein
VSLGNLIRRQLGFGIAVCLCMVGFAACNYEVPIVQDLNSNDRKYAYVAWKLSDDGRHLALRNVSDKVIPKETKDSATVVALLNKDAHNPDLLGEEIEFRKVK